MYKCLDSIAVCIFFKLYLTLFVAMYVVVGSCEPYIHFLTGHRAACKGNILSHVTVLFDCISICIKSLFNWLKLTR